MNKFANGAFVVAFLFVLFFGASFSANAGEEIGSVDTEFKAFGANHKIIMEVFDDPMVQAISPALKLVALKELWA